MIRRLSVALALTVSCGGAGPAAKIPTTATPPAFRLPGDVAPARYALDLTLDPTADNFRGEIAIELAVKRPTAVVWLNAVDLDIDSVKLTADGRELATRVIPGGAEIIGIAADAPLAPGKDAKLILGYRGKIDKVRSRGIYRQNEGDDWYLFTFFEATDARRAFPCFDEPPTCTR